ncbi:MAG: apolipoprotein N-acyltransferase [Planctomycetes bacterium]|nr:apolipoprotein N-acyltransferase [Planctomycetota bacterium]
MAKESATQASVERGTVQGESRWVPQPWSRWALLAGLMWSVLMALAFPLPGLAPRPGNEPTSGWGAVHVWCQGGIWPLALLAWVPLAMLVSRASRDSSVRVGRMSVWYAVGTLAFWAFEQWWVSRISAVGYVPFVALMACYGGLHCWGGLRIARRTGAARYGVILFAAWVLAVDVFRGEIALKGYPWYLAGHPLIRWGPGASMASLWGAYGVSFAVLLVSLGLGWMVVRREARLGGMVAIGFGVLMGVPAMLMKRSGDAAPPQIVTVGLIQTNVAQNVKMGWGPEEQFKEWQTLEAMTARAATPMVGLIVWPETMMPGMAIDDASVKAMKDAQIYYNVKTAEGEQKLAAAAFADRLREVQKELNVPIVVGEEGFDNLRFEEVPGGIDVKYDARYNSAFVVQNGKVEGARYDKLHLTPFGEEMPYISSVEWLERLLLSFAARGMKFDLAEGKRPVRLLPQVKMTAPGSGQAKVESLGTSVMPIATPICFEIADSALVRSLVQATTPSMPLPTAMIVTITNDGWFGDSDMTRRQHTQLARWRAAELGLPVLRAANTGDSGGFDAWGQPIAAMHLPPAPRSREEGIAIMQVPTYTVQTLYARIGNALAWVIGAIGVGACAWTWKRTKLET